MKMSTDLEWWRYAGNQDRELGYDVPALTEEDFYIMFEDESVAKECYEAYFKGFFREDG